MLCVRGWEVAGRRERPWTMEEAISASERGGSEGGMEVEEDACSGGGEDGPPDTLEYNMPHNGW